MSHTGGRQPVQTELQKRCLQEQRARPQPGHSYFGAERGLSVEVFPVKMRMGVKQGVGEAGRRGTVKRPPT